MKKYTVLAINGIKKLVLIGAGWGNENGNVIFFFFKCPYTTCGLIKLVYWDLL